MDIASLFQPETLIQPIHENLAHRSVTSLTSDSRTVEPGSLFFCINGSKLDGRLFIDDALKRGASAVVCEATGDAPADGARIYVKDIRRAVSEAATTFYGKPSERLKNLAITGTSGKTSVAWMLSHALSYLDTPTILGGTLGFTLLAGQNSPAQNLKELSNTTMDPIFVHGLLADGLKRGAHASVFEATSQGVVQSRMRHVAWDGAIFTNLSRDHLDLHGSMERYEAAKRELFISDLTSSPKTGKFAIFNGDDGAGKRIGYELKATHPEIQVLFVSLMGEEGADYLIQNLECSTDGLSFTLAGPKGELTIRSRLTGTHNAYNIACSAVALLQFGYPISDIAKVIPNLPSVPGRLEPVRGANRTVYVDYAHKPDALEKVLTFLKPVCKGRLISVIGCGGDRDKGKRPVMGAISRQFADVTVLTSDNPRTEDPLEIIQQIRDGIGATEGYQLLVEPDRRKAIQAALEIAAPDDIILLAGKGHEPYQEIQGVKHPFSDVLVVKELMRRFE